MPIVSHDGGPTVYGNSPLYLITSPPFHSSTGSVPWENPYDISMRERTPEQMFWCPCSYSQRSKERSTCSSLIPDRASLQSALVIVRWSPDRQAKHSPEPLHGHLQHEKTSDITSLLSLLNSVQFCSRYKTKPLCRCALGIWTLVASLWLTPLYQMAGNKGMCKFSSLSYPPHSSNVPQVPQVPLTAKIIMDIS